MDRFVHPNTKSLLSLGHSQNEPEPSQTADIALRTAAYYKLE